MRSFLQPVNQCYAAGAIGGLAQGLAIWIISQLGVFYLLGVPVVQDLTAPWLLQRMASHGIWGLLFLIPLPGALPLAARGVMLGLVPALAALLVINPLLDGAGLFGLSMGWGWPIIVVAFNVLWGLATAYWLQWSGGEAGGESGGAAGGAAVP